jgi:hypothetical protein
MLRKLTLKTCLLWFRAFLDDRHELEKLFGGGSKSVARASKKKIWNKIDCV